MLKVCPATRRFLAVVAIGIAVLGAPSRAGAQTTVAGGVVTLRGTVEAIDYTNRIIVIRGDRGAGVVLDVPASVTRFTNMKVGDIVTASYDDRVNARIKAAGEPPVDTVSYMGLVAAPGPLPSGYTGSTRTVTVTVRSVDPATRMVSFEGPQGRLYVRHFAETVDPSLLAGIAPGTRVDVTWNQITTIEVQSAATVVPAVAGVEHPWTASLTFGLDNSFSGKMITPGTGTIDDVPVELDETTFDEVYGRMGLFRLSVARRSSPRSEVFGNFVMSSSDAEPVVIGQLGAAGATVPVTAQFEDYAYWGIEGGQRFFFSRVRFTPFVGYYVGINRFETIRATVTAPEIGLQLAVDRTGEFFDESWALSVAPIGGFLVGLGPIEGIVQVDFRYIGELSDVVPLADAGLRDVNRKSSRWSFPFTVGARVRF